MGFLELLPCVHGLSARGGSCMHWVTPFSMVGTPYVILRPGLRTHCGWQSLAPGRARWSPLLTGGGNNVCPVWARLGCAAPPHVMWAWEAPLAWVCYRVRPERVVLTALLVPAPTGRAVIFVQHNFFYVFWDFLN